MSMVSADLLTKVKTQMRQLGLTQKGLASACNLDQGHISKVLSGKLKLADKTKTALTAWLAEKTDGETIDNSEVHEIVERLTRAPSDRRMQIMQLLRIVDRLAR